MRERERLLNLPRCQTFQSVDIDNISHFSRKNNNKHELNSLCDSSIHFGHAMTFTVTCWCVQARLRVMTFLGRVLSHAENKLYLQGQDTIYGHLHGDWPHLEHLLRQAIHCTCNTYPAFLQVSGVGAPSVSCPVPVQVLHTVVFSLPTHRQIFVYLCTTENFF